MTNTAAVQAPETKPGYKHTPLGWIPKGWSLTRIGKVSQVVGGGTPSTASDDYWGGDINWFTPTEIGSKYVSDSRRKITDKGLKNSSAKKLPSGTLLLSTRASVGDISIALKECTTNQGFQSLIVNEYCDGEYLYYWVLDNKNTFLKRASGSTFLEISGKQVAKLLIPLPPIEEQKAIAGILSTWDEAIETTQNLIAAKQLQKKALMQQLLTGKTRFKEFTDEWKEYSYNDILKEVKRPIVWDDEELYDLISVRRRSGGLFYRESLQGKKILTKNLREAHEGDFLMSKMQILHGASGLTTKEFDRMKISGSYIAVIAKDTNILDMEYFNRWSQTPKFYHQTYVSSYGVHIEKMTFDYKSLLKLKLELPSIAEQQKIAGVLQAADAEIATLQEKLAAQQAQKKGLMQQLLTGKKRVRVN